MTVTIGVGPSSSEQGVNRYLFLFNATFVEKKFVTIPFNVILIQQGCQKMPWQISIFKHIFLQLLPLQLSFKMQIDGFLHEAESSF